MTQLLENLILNPVEFAPSLPEIDLSAGGLFIGEAGPDYGENSQVVERVKREVGEGVVSRHWPSVECSIPLWVGADRSVKKAVAYSPLEAFAGELQRGKTLWVRRDFSDLDGFSGSVGCPVDAGGLTTPRGFGPNEILLKLSRSPIWFSTVEVIAGEAEGTDVRHLQLELAELLGTAPGLIRVVVKNNGEDDWRGCSVAIECDDYSDAETAELHYSAKDLTLQGGSEVAEDEAGDEVVKCPKLTKGWVTVLSSEIDEVGHMTHVGPRRMLFRLEDPSEKTDAERLAEWEAEGGFASGEEKPTPQQAQWKLEWRALGSAAWIQTMDGSTPRIVSSGAVGDYQLVDLGECRPERAITGDQRWEFRLQVCSPGGVELQPLVRDVYPMSTEQWMRVADTSDNTIDGEPAKGPATVEDNSGVGTIEWSNPGNAASSDETSATATNSESESKVSHYLKATKFGFAIPSTATIVGIKAAISRKSTGSDNHGVKDNRVRIIKGGTIKETVDEALTALWSGNSFATALYGGPTSLWGQTWTPSDINSSTFGIALSATVGPKKGTSNMVAKVDAITILVAYSDGGNQNRICFTSRSVEFSDNGVRRQHITDDIWGDLVPEGFLLYSPPAGQAGQSARILIVPSVGDFGARADSTTAQLSAKVLVRPAYLFARESL